MSLFNDMLRDLEARGARLPAAAVPVPPVATRRRSHTRLIGSLLTVLALSLIATGWLYLAAPPQNSPQQIAPQPAAPPPTAPQPAAQPEQIAATPATPAPAHTPEPKAEPATPLAVAPTPGPTRDAEPKPIRPALAEPVKPVPAAAPLAPAQPAQPAMPVATAEAAEPVTLHITRSTPAEPQPDLSQHLQSLARQQLQQGNAAAAATLLASAAPPIAENRDYHALLGYAWQQAGQPAQAATVYRQLVTLDSSQGAWWLGLALAEQARGENTAALQAFQRAQSSGGLESRVLRYVEQRIDALSSQTLPSQP